MYRPHEIQREVLPCLLNEPSRDVFCISPPGSGKTIALCISILQKLDLSSQEAQNTPQALILVPSWDLAEHMRDLFEAIGQFLRGLSVSIVTPGRASEPTTQQYHCPVIIGTPLSVLGKLKQRRSSSRQIKILVVDAAEDMLELQGMGDSCLRVKGALRYHTGHNQFQIALFTATSPEHIKRYGEKFAPGANLIEKKTDESPKLVRNVYVKASAEKKLDKLIDIFDCGIMGQVIIFCIVRPSIAPWLIRIGK